MGSVEVKRRGRPPKASKQPFSEVKASPAMNIWLENLDLQQEPQPRPKGRENSFKQILKKARERGPESAAGLPPGKLRRVDVQGTEATSPTTVLQFGMPAKSPQTEEQVHKTTMTSTPSPSCPHSAPVDRVRPRRLFDSSDGAEAAAVTPTTTVKVKPSPKKKIVKNVELENQRIDDFFSKRKSPRFSEKKAKCHVKDISKKSVRVSPKASPVIVPPRKKGVSGPTCRAGKSVQEGQIRKYVKKVIFEGVEYRVGDDVYVKRGVKEDTNVSAAANEQHIPSDSDEEVEDCMVCGETGKEVMIECDACLGGFHLGCLLPPLEDVPEGDWSCPTCEALARGENVVPPTPMKKRRRTARERFLAEEIWAAHIEKLWRDKDGSLFYQGRWWAIPEETAEGRQQWHGRRELFRSNMVDDNEMDTILRHCYVMTPDEYARSGQEGDDVFMCGHEYDFRHQTFKRIANEFDDASEKDDTDDESFDPARGSFAQSEGDEDDSESDGNSDCEEDMGGKFRKSGKYNARGRPKSASTARAANLRKGRIEGVGAKAVPQVRKRPLTDLEKAKAALGLGATPATLPCRDREKSEIEAFVKDAVAAGEHCLGRCLYISGVPGTGKTATVLEVMKGLRAKVDKDELPPYRFVEINGLRLPSPEHAYTVLHEALTGQHCGWRRALQFLDARFSDMKPLKGVHARPCILLVDELDLLVTRNQSVLYNLFDWPSRANSRLIVIGIANTMDLPERMLPRIASRLGLHRISFGPYSHTQLQQILATRLEGIPAFDKQAVEFASRKVAAVSGDARRALELCRRAAEIAEQRIHISSICPTSLDPSQHTATPSTELSQAPLDPLLAVNKLIGMADIEAAITEMFQAPHIQFMKRCAKYQKIFLVSMVTEQHRTTMVETTFEKVVAAFMRLCNTHKEHLPGVDSLMAIGCKLGASRLLLCESAIRHRHQKLQLNFPSDDVSFALKGDKELPWLAKYL